MAALMLVIVCLVVGAIAVRLPHPEQLVQGLNWWVLTVALPAMVLQQVSRLEWEASLLFAGAGLWLVFAGAWLFIAILGKAFGWSRLQIGALVLTAGLGNTSFVGYPLIEALRGLDALGVAVIADQLGSFLMLSTVAVLVGSYYAGSRASAPELLKRLLTFPAFVALLVAIALRPVGGLPDLLDDVAGRLGMTLTPLALFSVGMQLRLRMPAREDRGPLLGGLTWKLLLAPLLVFAVGYSLPLERSLLEITTLQAAMAPMITGGLLAQQLGLARDLATRMVGFGILLSLLTVPLVNFLLTGGF